MVEFTTKEGHTALILNDRGVGFIPSVNPFGFGCGCCGAYHQVSHETTADGELVLGYMMNDEETRRLREHLGSDSLPEKYVRAQQLLANWQATGQAVQAALLEVVEMMGVAVKSVQLGDFSGAVLACKAAEELVSQFVPAEKKEEKRVITFC